MYFLTKINYMKHAKAWITLSIILTVASLTALAALGLNKGIDFTGGVLLDIRYDKVVEAGDVERVVTQSTGTTPVVKAAQLKGEETVNKSEFLVTTKELDAADREKLYKDLESLGTYTKVGEETVSASVSSELTQRAALAIVIAAALQILYIWWRFQFKFGITAVIALLHDLVITLGLMSIFRVQINSAFVAAILTVLGYSMNDTVVVFDRIREDLKNRKKGEALEALATRAIQEVITRSLYTGVSVQMMLIAMLVWGGDSVWDFAMTLLIGITSGTYSSIFIAAALWLFWQQRDDKKAKKVGRTGPAKA